MKTYDISFITLMIVVVSIAIFIPIEGLQLSTTNNSKHHSTKSEISRRNLMPFIALATTTVSVGMTNIAPANSEVGDDVGVDEGYTSTPRGLKYRVTKPPTDIDSSTPARAQKVKASYTLYLNGFPEDTPSSVKVDSSKGFLGERPFEFLAGVSQVIKGWDLAIMDMKVGEARKLVIESPLGYGEKGAGGKIPGGATLYFDVELLELGAKSKIGPEQEKWLEEHPL